MEVGDQEPHSHGERSLDNDSAERAAATVVASLGLVANATLLAVLAARRHTRRLASTFCAHAALLNMAACVLAAAFGGAPGLSRFAVDACNSLGVAYIVVTTNSAFNLATAACCEVYLLGRRRRRPPATASCALFGLLCVHFTGFLLHLGPTVLGANFVAAGRRCHLVYGQAKNYVVYATWIITVAVGLAAAVHYLALFSRSIADAIPEGHDVAGGDTAACRLAALSGAKRSRCRALWTVCGLHAACWLPLFCLLLFDSHFAAGRRPYQILSAVFVAKATLEPVVMLTMDSSVSLLALIGRRADSPATEEELDSLLEATAVQRFNGDLTIGSRLSSHASAGAHELQPLRPGRQRHSAAATPTLSSV